MSSMARPDTPARPSHKPLIFLILVLLNSAYLAIFNRLPWPPRTFMESMFYEGNVLLHLLFGLIFLWVMIKVGARWRRSIRESEGAVRLFGTLSAFSTFV